MFEEAALRLLLLAASISCLASFAWGMRYFFSKPSGRNLGMDVIYVLGILFSAYQLIGIGYLGEAGVRSGFAAIGMFVLSLVLFWSAVHANRKTPLSFAFSTDAPAHLVTTGPYRFTRHPFYISYLAAWLAGWVATSNVAMSLPFVTMLIVYYSAARQEERKFANSPLAQEYDQYRRSSGLGVRPRIGSSDE